MAQLAEPAVIDDTLLDTLGNVDTGYQHHARVATPGELLVLPGALAKWYNVHRVDVPVPDAFVDEARAFLLEEADRGRLDLGYGLCFTVLHASTAHAFLIFSVWNGNQELWATFYARGQHAQPDRGWELIQHGRSHPVMCVWELGAAVHEREAWNRYLYSARDSDAKRAYLNDLYSGPV